MSFFKSLRAFSDVLSPNAPTIESDVQLGQELLALYESYWQAMRNRTSKISKNAKISENETLQLCDYIFAVYEGWMKLKTELDTLPQVRAQIDGLSDSLLTVSSKLERLEQSLEVVTKNREAFLLQEWQTKKDNQLAAQQQSFAREISELLQAGPHGSTNPTLLS